MVTSLKPKDTYQSHLQKLIARWQNLLDPQSFTNIKYYELYERSKTILNQICPDDQAFIDRLDSPSSENIERIIGKLRAAQLDLNDGILSLEQQIQAQISIDLMKQAEALLGEDESANLNHVPSAVLAGAVLEHFLRTLCNRQSPAISLNLDNGNFKTLATLVNDLEKAELYNSVEKKQLKVWVEIRNFAAHGQFDQFNYDQVVKMIEGIKSFIDDHK